jgi:hypothetical protein
MSAARAASVTIFSTKAYDRRFLDGANVAAGEPHRLRYLEARLTHESAPLTQGAQAVCASMRPHLALRSDHALDPACRARGDRRCPRRALPQTAHNPCRLVDRAHGRIAARDEVAWTSRSSAPRPTTGGSWTGPSAAQGHHPRAGGGQHFQNGPVEHVVDESAHGLRSLRQHAGSSAWSDRSAR